MILQTFYAAQKIWKSIWKIKLKYSKKEIHMLSLLSRYGFVYFHPFVELLFVFKCSSCQCGYHAILLILTNLLYLLKAANWNDQFDDWFSGIVTTIVYSLQSHFNAIVLCEFFSFQFLAKRKNDEKILQNQRQRRIMVHLIVKVSILKKKNYLQNEITSSVGRYIHLTQVISKQKILPTQN